MTLNKSEVSWKSPSNIALIKYWGKKDNQIALNPSFSFTLKNWIELNKQKDNINKQLNNLPGSSSKLY